MRLIVSLITSLALTVNASAQWLYQERDESAFSTDKMHIMLSENEGKGLGVRCRDGDSELIFVLPEKIDGVDVLNKLEPKLLFRVDKNEPHELSATVFDQVDKFLVMTSVEDMVIEEIRDAKSRIVVALDLAGSQFVETRYSAKGSTTAANKLLKNCRSSDAD